MWPFSTIRKLRDDYTYTVRKGAEYVGLYHAARKEIADLKDSNARLADALKAAKVRAEDTW